MGCSLREREREKQGERKRDLGQALASKRNFTCDRRYGGTLQSIACTGEPRAAEAGNISVTWMNMEAFSTRANPHAGMSRE